LAERLLRRIEELHEVCALLEDQRVIAPGNTSWVSTTCCPLRLIAKRRFSAHEQSSLLLNTGR
jgi:hypothetical protein